MRQQVWHRSGGRCEVVLDGHRCVRDARDPDHTIARSTVGKNRRAEIDRPELVIAICRYHHDQKVWPYYKGRLTIVAVGDGTFRSAVIRKLSKWSWTA